MTQTERDSYFDGVRRVLTVYEFDTETTGLDLANCIIDSGCIRYAVDGLADLAAAAIADKERDPAMFHRYRAMCQLRNHGSRMLDRADRGSQWREPHRVALRKRARAILGYTSRHTSDPYTHSATTAANRKGA